jgi:hypothetical protein
VSLSLLLWLCACMQALPYDAADMRWNDARSRNMDERYCYCGKGRFAAESMLRCDTCGNFFHGGAEFVAVNRLRDTCIKHFACVSARVHRRHDTPRHGLLLRCVWSMQSVSLRTVAALPSAGPTTTSSALSAAMASRRCVSLHVYVSHAHRCARGTPVNVVSAVSPGKLDGGGVHIAVSAARESCRGSDIRTFGA